MRHAENYTNGDIGRVQCLGTGWRGCGISGKTCVRARKLTVSRDCDYLFSWDWNATDHGDVAASALQAIQTYGRKGTGVLIDSITLYWSCQKHGLILSDIRFPLAPNQILERSSGIWCDITRLHIAAQSSFPALLGAFNTPEPAGAE